jgi:ribosome-associated protein
MDIRKLQRAIVDGLEDVKAHNIVVFNTEHLSPLFERVIVASGASNRQTKALASSVRETVKSRGLPILSVEGAENGEWIIVDCGAAVAHIMQPAIRDYYRLEEIWGDKPVKMKIDGEARPLAALPEPTKVRAGKSAVPKRIAARPAPVKKTAGKKPVRKAGAGKKASAPRKPARTARAR